MAEITAAAVKTLREQTGLPMMDCKRALHREPTATRKRRSNGCASSGKKVQEKRAGRATTHRPDRRLLRVRAGRRGHDRHPLRNAPVANNEHFIGLGQRPGPAACHGSRRGHARCLARPAVAQPARARRSRQQFDDLNNRIRETFMLRADCAGRRSHGRLCPSQRRGRPCCCKWKARGRPSWPATSACTSRPCGRSSSARRTSIRPWWPRSARSWTRR